ncbi:hypothetical protein MNBD_GAMMA12-1389 [hydrothermal vent metagenome]|uniref:Uncharacterized protein n=1 Tax=hydrothermal vent metagenome TaxID=652676 RepID=A0A3B0YMZ5_9ZZZZ
MLFAIARNDFKSLFRIPLGWIILALSQFLLTTIYYVAINHYLNKQYLAIPVNGVSDGVISTLFGSSAYILLIITPILAMRAISSERQKNTFVLLLAAPISEFSLLFGKLLGLLFFLSIQLVCMLLMSLLLAFGATLDYGVLFCSLAGLLLLTITCTSISLYIASMTAQAAVAISGAMSVLIFMFFLESMALTRFYWLDQTLTWLSLFSHLESFLNGNINSRDIIYYCIISSATLYLTLLRLRTLRQYA